jgi:D-aminopeptidase
MPRIRDLDICPNTLQTGKHNAITDVADVSVGHSTVIEGAGAWTGCGPFRTGVTLIRPHSGNLYADKVSASVYIINGFGKYAGLTQVREVGTIETPIALTSTLNVPRVADALITLAIEENPYISIGFAETGRRGYASVNPVVGECNDGFLNDAHSRIVGETDVRAALDFAASGVVAEGSIGAGTGTSCFGWKGGIGTASRVIDRRAGGFTLGALVQTNFGNPEELVIAGVPIGRKIHPPDYQTRSDDGSCMIVLATDAPLDSRQLGRLCRRAAFGLARTGSTCHAGSGDVVIAFSTTYRIPDRPKTILLNRPTLTNEHAMITQLGIAVVEAVLNSLFMSETMVGRDGNTRYGLPIEEVMQLVHTWQT